MRKQTYLFSSMLLILSSSIAHSHSIADWGYTSSGSGGNSSSSSNSGASSIGSFLGTGSSSNTPTTATNTDSNKNTSSGKSEEANQPSEDIEQAQNAVNQNQNIRKEREAELITNLKKDEDTKKAQAESQSQVSGQTTSQAQNTKSQQPKSEQTNSINQKGLHEAEAQKEVKRMENFIMATQSLSMKYSVNLSPEKASAINLLGSTLMQYGVENLSGISGSMSVDLLNKNIGCINNFGRNSDVSQAANSMMGEFLKLVNLRTLFSKAQKLGSDYKAPCN